MATVKPFKALRPAKGLEAQVGALPYDVVNSEEAREIVKKEPMSFLQLDRGETLLSQSVAFDDPRVYECIRQRFETLKEEGVFVSDEETSFFIYEQIYKGRSQCGLVGCVSVEDYKNGVIKRHEKTREVKEVDRIHHIEALQAHTGPIFLATKDDAAMSYASTIRGWMAKGEMLFEFTADDDVIHRGYLIQKDDQASVQKTFEEQTLYIADGHHRAASAYKVACEHPENLEAQWFLAVIFPSSELAIMDYNRVVKDMKGYSLSDFLEALAEDFDVAPSQEPIKPRHKGEFGMYIAHQWYRLRFKRSALTQGDVIKDLDVSILQDFLLKPILGIDDPRTDERIDFVGGIRGLSGLEKRVHDDMAVAFSMYPTQMDELMSVADQDLLMPPKSTWFEPKLRSGLFIHSIRD